MGVLRLPTAIRPALLKHESDRTSDAAVVAYDRDFDSGKIVDFAFPCSNELAQVTSAKASRIATENGCIDGP